MFEHDEEDRFAAALRELTDLHEAALSLVASGAESERAFADGLRVGDVVRRAVRQGHRHRPDAGDVAAIESIAAHLRIVLSRALDSPEVERLRGAMATGVASAIARSWRGSTKAISGLRRSSIVAASASNGSFSFSAAARPASESRSEVPSTGDPSAASASAYICACQ